MLRAMLIRLEGEDIESAVERLRKRGGDRDWTKAITRVLTERDEADRVVERARDVQGEPAPKKSKAVKR